MSRGKPVLVRISLIIAVLLLVSSAAGAAFIGGYGLGFARFTAAYGEIAVLKARAAELEAEILHLKNYAALIDALALDGEAVKDLVLIPKNNQNVMGSAGMPGGIPAQEHAPRKGQ